MVKSLGFGLIVMFAIYLIMWALQGSSFGGYVSDLFIKRGWVPYVLTLLFGWSFGILFLKWQQLRKQRLAMVLDVLPYQIAEQIEPATTHQFLSHIAELPKRLQGSFIVNRVRRGLEHFRVRQSNPEVASMMSSQSEIDASAIQSSYTLIKVFCWAIPILGFIGTVLGISVAIAAFDGDIDASADTAKLMKSIKGVTGGLGIAFDTTLLALVMSIIVSIPASALQKSEEDLLNSIDQYCNENLLKRLDDGGLTAGAEGADLSQVLSALGEGDWASKQSVILEKFAETQRKMQEIQIEQLAALRQRLGSLDKEFHEAVEKIEKDTSISINQSVQRMERYFEGLHDGIGALNRVLKELGEKQVVIKKKWF
ncbi:MAG: MotA/TolQ/ExbB proton channel family protein [Verrucomicrobiales bacterium]